MGENKIQALVAAFAADALAQHSYPWASTAGVVVASGSPWVGQKTRRALEIVRDHLSDIPTRLSDGQREEVAAMLNRYLRDAQEGAAEENLHLMATLMAGVLQNEEVNAATYLHEANIIASLNAEEILILGSIWNATKDDGKPRNIGRGLRDARDLLIPKPFSDYRKLIEAAAPLARTGYLMPLSAPDGHMEYRTTTAYERLAARVRFMDPEEAKAKDPGR